MFSFAFRVYNCHISGLIMSMELVKRFCTLKVVCRHVIFLAKEREENDFLRAVSKGQKKFFIICYETKRTVKWKKMKRRLHFFPLYYFYIRSRCCLSENLSKNIGSVVSLISTSVMCKWMLALPFHSYIIENSHFFFCFRLVTTYGVRYWIKKVERLSFEKLSARMEKYFLLGSRKEGWVYILGNLRALRTSKGIWQEFPK